MKPSRATAIATLVVGLAAALAACDRDDAESSAQAARSAAPPASSASGRAAPPVVNGVPLPDAIVRQAVNPKRVEPYSGPTGTIRGVVTVRGDQPPPLPMPEGRVPQGCDEAALRARKLFETTQAGAVQDALVAVTGYEAFVPATSPARRIEAKACSWGRRTIALTFGQRLEIVSKDGEPYVPMLLGGAEKAMLVAIPGGDSIKLQPVQPGRYALTDKIKQFMQAEVLVLKYATFDVTGAEGRYSIPRVPAGQEVTVSALLPSIMQKAEKKVTLKPGETRQVDLSLEYHRPSEEQATDAAAPPMPH